MTIFSEMKKIQNKIDQESDEIKKKEYYSSSEYKMMEKKKKKVGLARMKTKTVSFFQIFPKILIRRKKNLSTLGSSLAGSRAVLSGISAPKWTEKNGANPHEKVRKQSGVAWKNDPKTGWNDLKQFETFWNMLKCYETFRDM